jgi:hypothetical protein
MEILQITGGQRRIEMMHSDEYDLDITVVAAPHFQELKQCPVKRWEGSASFNADDAARREQRIVGDT